MQLLKLTDIYGLDAGDIVKGLKAKVKKVWQPKEGEGQKGPWKNQGLELTNGDKVLKVLVWNHEETFSPKLEGKTVVLLSAQGGKGWRGMKAEDNEYKGVVSRQIHADANMTLELAAEYEMRTGEDSDIAPQKAAEPEPEAQTEKPAPRRYPVSESGVHDGVHVAKNHLAKSANLMRLCMDAATTVCKNFEAKHGEGSLAPEQFQAITSTFFIAADKAGLVNGMPLVMSEPAKAPQKPAPEPEPDLGDPNWDGQENTP